MKKTTIKQPNPLSSLKKISAADAATVNGGANMPWAI